VVLAEPVVMAELVVLAELIETVTIHHRGLQCKTNPIFQIKN